MANPIDYYGDITLHGGALKSVALEKVTELPATPVDEQIVVFNNTVQVYLNGEWSVLGSSSDIQTVQQALTALTSRVSAVETGKVDKVEGKQLSTEDYTTTEKTKLAGIAEGAQVNVIESVEVDGVAQEISGKKVTLNLEAYAKTADLVSVLDWKGTVATVSALPTASEANKGDIYHVTENGGEYVSDGSDWQELGSIVDLSDYYNKTEIDGKVGDLNTAIGKKVDALTTKPTAGTYTKVTINAEGQVTAGQEKIAIADISDIATAEVATAGKLKTAQNISITGGATASAVAFDGTGAVALNVTSIDGTKVSGAIPVASVPTITTAKISDFTSKVQETVGAQFKSVALSSASVSGNKYTITTAKKAFGVMVLNAGVQVFVSTTVTDTSIVLDFNSAITPADFTVTYIEQF